MFDDENYAPPDHALLSWLLERVVSLQNRFGIALWQLDLAGWIIFAVVRTVWSFSFSWSLFLLCFVSTSFLVCWNYRYVMRRMKPLQTSADERRQILWNLRWSLRSCFFVRCSSWVVALLWLSDALFPPLGIKTVLAVWQALWICLDIYLCTLHTVPMNGPGVWSRLKGKWANLFMRPVPAGETA